MTYKENITAILECYFTGFKKEIIDSACNRILEQQPCDDCISRQAVLDKIKEVCFSKEQKWVDFRVSQGSNGQRDFIINFIESLPSVQPKTGHWITLKDEYGDVVEAVCSCCGKNGNHKWVYCPKCGARMVSK